MFLTHFHIRFCHICSFSSQIKIMLADNEAISGGNRARGKYEDFTIVLLLLLPIWSAFFQPYSSFKLKCIRTVT